MKDQFLPYELAIQLKELGFNKICLGWYNANQPDILEYANAMNFEDWLKGKHCTAPLWQQAFDFFLEKYEINCILFSDGIQWTFDLRWVEEDDIMQYPSTQFPKKEIGRSMHNTREEARFISIEKLIEITKTL